MAVFVKTDTGLFPAATVQGPQGPQGEPGPTGPQGPEGGALIGEIKIWPVATPPAKHLLCDGALPLIADYPDLYAVLGTSYGGDGVTTFGLPDLRDRVPVGASATKPLGSTGGADSVSLTTAQMPSHTHERGTFAADSTGTAHTHTDNFAVSAGGTHAHTVGTLATGGNSTDHVHTPGSHTHTLGTHTHGLNGHVHGMGTHTHGLNDHTHAQAIHSHPMPHTHTINHSHTVNASTVDGAHKGTGRFGEFASREPSTNAFVSGSDTSTSGAESTPNTSNSVAVETGGSGTDRTTTSDESTTTGNTGNTTGPTGGSGGPSASNTGINTTDHTHPVTGSVASTPDHTHGLTGGVTSSGAHSHSMTGTLASTGDGLPVGIQNKYVALNYIIRALA